MVVIAVADPFSIMGAKRQPTPGRNIKSRPPFPQIIFEIRISQEADRNIECWAWRHVLLELADALLAESTLSEKHCEWDFGKPYQSALAPLLFVQIGLDHSRVQLE